MVFSPIGSDGHPIRLCALCILSKPKETQTVANTQINGTDLCIEHANYVGNGLSDDRLMDRIIRSVIPYRRD